MSATMALEEVSITLRRPSVLTLTYTRVPSGPAATKVGPAPVGMVWVTVSVAVSITLTVFEARLAT